MKKSEKKNPNYEPVRHIYLLWNIRDEVVNVTSRLRRMREALEGEVHHKEMQYGNPAAGMLSIPDQIRDIRRDWKLLQEDPENVAAINKYIVGGHITVCKNGENWL